MPFDLSNTPTTFQGYNNQILAKKLDVFVIIYLNNILICIEDPSQVHVKVIWWVLKNFRKQGLFANIKKCQFYQDEICFLGYVVSA